MDDRCWIGLDVGSVSINLAAVAGKLDEGTRRDLEADGFSVRSLDICGLSNNNDSPNLILSPYIRHQGEVGGSIEILQNRFKKHIPESGWCSVWVTGSGGTNLRQRRGYQYVNEFQAAARGVAALCPKVKTLFELGGERSKYIRIEPDASGSVRILEYECNGECAAGTGSFFDQQAGRLKIPINETGSIIQGAGRTASIAGRCSVFAKSDMIHAQQLGYTPAEVLKGLCEAVARNFKGTIAKGKQIEVPVALIGGLAQNPGVVDAMRRLFGLEKRHLIVPPEHAWMGAVGSALTAQQKDTGKKSVTVFFEPKKKQNFDIPRMPPLRMDKVRLMRNENQVYRFPGKQTVDAFLGIDIGSVSTNLALLDESGSLIFGLYRMTDGRPVEVVTRALKDMGRAMKNRVRIQGAATTGSGRELIGALVGADIIKDEITAHKTGAVDISRRIWKRGVDTIFEIGGQDSKFISIQDGVVVDFSLNEACAAGTGSFLEEQAQELGISIRNEFAELALSSETPLRLGERCTVFMEKELIPYCQRGIDKKDIAAGLAYSIVQNYLNRVVKRRHIGERIFFQGGTAYNDSVAAAFATLLDREIVVPPHNGIMGAIGAAMLVRDTNRTRGTGFRDWNLDAVPRRMKTFTCRGCSNECCIQEFDVEGEKYYWGDKCSERYRKRVKSRSKAFVDDLIEMRRKWFEPVSALKPKMRGRVAIPMSLHFYDRLLFWKTYFDTLGFETVCTGPTTQCVIHQGVEAAQAEPCFPVQVAHGHTLLAVSLNPDWIFCPNVVSEEDPTNSVASFICPWTQTWPLVIRNTPAFETNLEKIWDPNIQFREGERFVAGQLYRQGRHLGFSKHENRRAVEEAYAAHRQFLMKIRRTGLSVFRRIQSENIPCVLLLGRPYNLYDSGLNLNIPRKLRHLYGVNVFPLDFLPLEEVDIRSVHDHMFWNYGRRILQAACLAAKTPNMHVIYLSNFKCGPDSYIRHYVEEILGRPFLFLQLDSHANDAGILTRIEAFLESHQLIS
ncbi:MAG TPA: hypothetical protein ENN03_09685 [bacterium]|nr:hypothetical protein [bacterium]